MATLIQPSFQENKILWTELNCGTFEMFLGHLVLNSDHISNRGKKLDKKKANVQQVIPLEFPFTFAANGFLILFGCVRKTLYIFFYIVIKISWRMISYSFYMTTSFSCQYSIPSNLFPSFSIRNASPPLGIPRRRMRIRPIFGSEYRIQIEYRPNIRRKQANMIFALYADPNVGRIRTTPSRYP